MIICNREECDQMAIEVVGAVIIKDKKILAAQRPLEKSLGGMWEFPGGKIEHGEEPKETLKREIEEEMSCSIIVNDFIVRSIYSYDFGDIALSTYFCEIENGYPVLNEHVDMKWLSVEELDLVEWAPADIDTLNLLKNNGLKRI